MNTGIVTMPRQQPKPRKPFWSFRDTLMSAIKVKTGDIWQEITQPGDDKSWILRWGGWSLAYCAVASLIVISSTPQKYIAVLGGYDIQALQIFLSIFGLAYAVIIGLLIVEARKRFHELSTILRDELKVISDINDCISYFDDEVHDNRQHKQQIRRLSLEYVQRLGGFEWDMIREARRGRTFALRYLDSIPDARIPAGYTRTMLEENPHIDSFLTPLISQMINANKELTIRYSSETCAKQKLIDKTCELTSLRTDRLELAENGLKGYLKFFLIFMSFITILVTIFASQGERIPQLLMVWATIAVIVGLFMILDDIDHPFSGQWRIDRKMLDSLEKKLE